MPRMTPQNPGSTNDPQPPSQPKRSGFNWPLGLIPVAALLIFLTVKMLLPPEWRPQLDIKNTGAVPVVITLRNESITTEPGRTWSGRFRAGDVLTIKAAQPADAPAQTIDLPKRNPKPWSWNPIVQHWTAEVNADDPKNIRFENRSFREVTNPQSPAEPWP